MPNTEKLTIIALGLLAAFVAADAVLAKPPTIDREAICAHFEQAGHKDCPDYELVRSNRSGEILIPAILSGSLSSVPVSRDGDQQTGRVTIPVKR